MRYLLLFLLLNSLVLNAKMLTKTKVLMGTFVTVMLQERDSALFESIYQLIKDVDKALSSYKTISPIYQLNHYHQATLLPYTYQALLLAQKYYKESDAYFNVAIGGITRRLYKFGENETLPSLTQLLEADIAFSKLHFDKKYAFVEDEVEIDLGGFGKGFAVDRVAQYMRAHHLKDARVALSGDIRCLGICKIDVFSPYSTESLLSFFTKEKDMGITTSGVYNRFVQTSEHNHLINPKTKESQQNFISVTLISKLASSDLDAYATAVSVMPKEKAYMFLKKFALAYIILDAEKKLHISKNIDNYVTNLLLENTPKK